MKLKIVLFFYFIISCYRTTEIQKKIKKKASSLSAPAVLDVDVRSEAKDKITSKEVIENKQESKEIISKLNDLKFNDIQKSENKTNMTVESQLESLNENLIEDLKNKIDLLINQLNTVNSNLQTKSKINQKSEADDVVKRKDELDHKFTEPHEQSMAELYRVVNILKSNCGQDLEDCYFLKRKDLNLEVKTDKAMINSIIALNHEINQLGTGKS